MSRPAAAPALASAVYEGTVRHRRHTPRPHSFSYRVAQLYLDLDEIDRVFAGRWLWSARRRNLAAFRRADYLGPGELPLAEAVRRRVESAIGVRPLGPIRLLTHLRYFGYVFNPVSFYYCYTADARAVEHVVAEITNTPWRERHAYVLSANAAHRTGRALRWDLAKTFHVSPFLPMERDYRWSLSEPGPELHVHMDVLEQGRPEVDATLALRRRPIDSRSLARVLWRYPFMTLQVVAGIHWQALRLWLMRTPVYDHPPRMGGVT
jgi:DUF1365 family protein